MGTRALLIGIMRAQRGKSPADDLLAAVGYPTQRLMEVLQDAASPVLDTNPAHPAERDDFPKLTSNAEAVLARAAERRDEVGPDVPLDIDHVFGALLDTPGSTAYEALEVAVEGKIAIEEVRDIYWVTLRGDAAWSFGERVAGRLPVEGYSGQVIGGHTGGVRALAFAPGGRELASAGADGAIQLWDPDSGEPTEALEGDATVPQTAVAYSPDGTEIVCGSEAGTISRWSRVAHSFTSAITTEHTGPVNALAFSPSGRLASAGGDARARVWDSDGDVVWGSQGEPGDAVHAVAFAPDDSMLATATANGAVPILDLASLDQVRVLEGSGEPLSLAFSPDGLNLASGSADGAIWLWDPRTGAARHLASQGSAVLALAFSPDGKTIAAAGEGGTVELFDAGGGVSRGLLSGHTGASRAVLFLADGLIASAGDDGSVRLWRSGPPGAPPPRDRVEWVSDRPTNTDELGRIALVGSLARRLERMSASPDSFLIHVDGAWGSGKSTVLTLLEEQLREEWLVVGFDAWRQSRVGPPWWALLVALRDCIAKPLSPFGRARLRAAEALERALQRGSVYPIGLLFLVCAAIAIVSLLASGSSDFARVVALVSATAAAITTLWVGVRVLAGFLMWESAAGARIYEKAHQNPTEGLASHFAWLAARAPGRVILFIDDVDRCQSEYVVDLLDSIQTLVRDAPQRARRRPRPPGLQPYFVVAADGRWIRRSYEIVYESLEAAVSEPGRPLGYLFLDKIFQLTVQVPVIGPIEQARYLRSLLGQQDAARRETLQEEVATREERIRASATQGELIGIVAAASPEARPGLTAEAVRRLSDPEVESATVHELQKYAGLLERNPRSMKRFVNAYSMALSTILLEGRNVAPDTLATWTILRMRWPALADHLQSHPDDLDLLSGRAERSAYSVPRALRPLFRAPEVQDVVRFDSGALASETLRELYGGAAAPPRLRQ